MKKKSFMVIVIVAILTWSGVAFGEEPLGETLSFREGYSYTEASNDIGEFFSNDYYHTEIPAHNASETSWQQYEKYALGEVLCQNLHHLYVGAASEGYGDWGSSALARIEDWVYWEFETPDNLHSYLRIGLVLYAAVDRTYTTPGLTGYSQVKFDCHLTDATTGENFWILQEVVTIDEPDGDLITDDIISYIVRVNLTPGHTYVFGIDLFEAEAWGHENVDSWTYGEIQGLGIVSVPLPSTLLLVSSGLLGLLAWRRKRKF